MINASNKMRFGLWLPVQDPPLGEHLHQKWVENSQVTAAAEKLNFDAVFTTEHHGIPDGYNPSPLVTLAFLAAHTRKIKLGTAVTLIPFYNPLHIAEDASVVDVLSGGRLILGVGMSNVEREFRMFGLDIKNQVELFEECLEVIRRAWTQDSFSFSGKHFTVKNVRVTPKPLQKPMPAIWGGALSERGCSRLGRLGLPWIAGGYGVSVLRNWAEIYRQAAESRGLLAQSKVILWRDCWVVDSPAEYSSIREKWWPHLRRDRWFYLTTFPGRGWGAGTREDLQPFLKNVQKEEDLKFENFEPTLLVGTPNEIVEQVKELQKELQCEYFILRCHFGTGPDVHDTTECLKRFANKVTPHLT